MDSILALPPSPPPPTSPMCSLVRRATLQLSNCDAHDLTLLALGLAVLGPTLTRGWVRRFEAALQRQPTSLDLQLQVWGRGREGGGALRRPFRDSPHPWTCNCRCVGGEGGGGGVL